MCSGVHTTARNETLTLYQKENCVPTKQFSKPIGVHHYSTTFGIIYNYLFDSSDSLLSEC